MGYIDSLIREGEHQELDFKFRVDDARKIAKTLVAFANTDGGRILIGVKDNGKITGTRSEEEFHVIEGASQLYTRPEVPFSATIHEVDNVQVLEIFVPPSSARPHFAVDENGKEWAYFRLDDQNHPANGVLLEFWRTSNPENRQTLITNYGEEHRILYQLFSEGERVSVSRLISKAKTTPERARHILATLLAWGLTQYNVDQKGIFFTESED